MKRTKKSIKEPDKFISFSRGIFNYISKNSKIFIIGVSILLCILILISMIYLYLKKREEKAISLFYKGLSMYEKGNYKSSLNKFEEVTNNFSNTSAYYLSLLYIGNCYYNIGDYDKAIDSYLKIYKKGKIWEEFNFIIINSIGYSYEAKRDYKNAIKYFSELKNGVIDEFYYINVGRCYEELKEKDKAKKIYKEFISKYPNSQYKIIIKEKINNLS